MNEVKELVEELRNKKSRDNRELLDRSADMIEKLAKELCEKSGCHHKCHDTKDCVVEDEALLLINENKSNNSDFKSNNFEVKSNEELFKQALVEGLNRRFDKAIEEAKKIEQIEEMAKAIHEVENLEWLEDTLAEHLYNAGYRKQSEGEWIKPYKGVCADPFYTCSSCGAGALLTQRVDNSKVVRVLTPYCPHCGARMKGE